MVSTLDILYIVLSLCALVVTAVIVMVGVEATRAIREVQKISQNVEHMTTLLERIAQITFPGIEQVAKGADALGSKLASFLKKKAETFK